MVRHIKHGVCCHDHFLSMCFWSIKCMHAAMQPYLFAPTRLSASQTEATSLKLLILPPQTLAATMYFLSL